MNTQFETFFVKALSEAKIDELVNTYREQGFMANKQVKIDDIEFDVIVEQPQKTIAFEIRVLPLSSTEMSDIDKHHQKAKALGYDFRLITIAKPKKSTIEIAWLDNALLKYVINHPIAIAMPQSIAAPLDYQQIETELKSIQITDSEARVSLNGNLSVHFQSHSDKDKQDNEQTVISEKLPFQGKLSLNLSEHQINDASLTVDNRYWYNESSIGLMNTA
jgi:hypothetical protein